MNRWLARLTLWQIAVVAVPLAAMPPAIFLAIRYPAAASWYFRKRGELHAACDFAGLVILALLLMTLAGYGFARHRYRRWLRRLGGDFAPQARRGGWRARLAAAGCCAAGIAAVVLLFSPVPLWLTVAAAALWLAMGITLRRFLARQQGFAGPYFSTRSRIAMAALLLLPAVTFGTMWLAALRSHIRIGKHLAAIHAGGEFIPFAEYHRLLPPVDGDGAPLFARIEAWQREHPEEVKTADLWLAEPNADPALAARIVQANAPILPWLDELGEFRHVRFRRDWSVSPYAMLQPELSPMRRLAQLQRVRINAAAAAGDYQLAARLWQQTGNLRMQVSEEPTTLSGLVAAAIEAIRIQSFMDCLNHGAPPPEEFLRRVIADAPAAEADLRSSFQRAMHSEAAAFLATDWHAEILGEMRSEPYNLEGPPPSMLTVYDRSATFWNWLEARNCDDFLENMVGICAAAGEDYYAASYPSIYELPEDHPLLFSRSFISVQRKTASAYSQVYLKIRAAAVMAALELHRNRYGDYPETLEALVPEFLDRLPVDPFNGEAMRYEIRDTDGKRTLAVFSVGDKMLGSSSFPGVVREIVF